MAYSSFVPYESGLPEVVRKVQSLPLINYTCALFAVATLMAAPLVAAQETRPAAPLGTSPPTMPTEHRLNLMIRTTIIALNQANLTGNYSVLRDLAAPSFQQANSVARLSEVFANLRQRGIDLAPILFYDPKLVRPPAIQTNGHLRLSGFFETRPDQVNFDLAFERVGNEWRLFGIAVEVSSPTSAAPSPQGEGGKTPPAGAAPKSGGPSASAPAQPKSGSQPGAAQKSR